MCPSSGEGKETPTVLGRLERSNLNHWISLSTRVSQLQCLPTYTITFRFVYSHKWIFYRKRRSTSDILGPPNFINVLADLLTTGKLQCSSS
jgi:hypothetical protein